MSQPTFRSAEPKDLALVYGFIRSLAEYERLTDSLVTTEQDIDRLLFQQHRAEVLFVMEDGAEVGFALFFHSFPAYIHGAGLFVEALYVKPEYRGRGYGRAVFQELAHIARERGCDRIEWCCLKWNPTLEFYKAMGADMADDLMVCRLNSARIAELAEERQAGQEWDAWEWQ